MDLTTGYMGLTLPSPLVASASPLTGNLDNLVALQRHGAGAVVLPSIFEEQIRRDGEIMDLLIDRGAESFGEALSYFPSQTAQRFDTVAQMDLVEQASQALDIPVIASLNGTTDSGWVDYAVELEARGAAAIELNVYLIPSDIALTGAQVEDRYCAIVSAVSKAVSIPVSVKIGPYFSAPGQMAGKLVQAGAKGLVLFNRFYQPDIDLSTLTLSASLELSNPDEMRLPLLWIGVLSGRIDAALAATTGRGFGRGCGKIPAGGCGCGHDHLGPAALWRRPHGGASRRPVAMAVGARSGQPRRHARTAQPQPD